MSEHLGEAFVRIRPDTTLFATELKADVTAAAAAASAQATAAAKSTAAAAKEAGVSVRYLATTTTALTRAENANARASKAAALALSEITGVTGGLAIAQERATRASALTVAADKAVEKSKLAVIAAEKTYAHAVATGDAAVVASMEKSLMAARGAYSLSEANLTAAASHEALAKAAITSAKAEQTAAKSSIVGRGGALRGGMAAGLARQAAAAAAAPIAAGAAAATKAGAGAGKQDAATRAVTQAMNLQTAAATRLTFANREVANASGVVAAAQITVGRANAAVLASEAALAAAQAVKIPKLIASAEKTLADSLAKEKSAIASVNLARAEQAELAAKSKLAGVTRAVVGASSELAAAQIVAGRAAAAVAASEASLAKARATGLPATIKTAEATHALAVAQQEEALTALEASKAQAAHGRSLAFARRGAIASALSLVGLRGATLAANGAFIAGAVAAITLAKALGSFARFQSQLNVLRVTTGATGDEMERVSALAIQLGADVSLPGVSAADAADAMTELAKAGLSVQDAMDGARGVLQLATAANISNADATVLAASALNAFGLAGNQAVRVADVLANAANAAQGSIQDMGFSLQQAAAVGRQVGLSLEDTTVFLTSLTRAGLRGSDAGTSLRTALLRLINPTKKIQKVFDELGLSLRDTEGNLRPDFFVNLGAALSDLSKKQRDAKIAILGGADAIRALSILSRQSIEDLIGLRNQIREQGTAADVASARTSGLSGAGLALANTFQTIALSIGKAAGPGLTGFVNGLNAAIGTIARSDNITKTLGDAFTIMGDAFQALGSVVGAVGLPAQLNLISRTINTIGIAPILGAVAAFKLLPVAVGAATTAINSSTAAMAANRAAAIASSVAIGGLGRTALVSAGAGLAALRAGMLALITSTTGIGIAVAAAAAGLIFLATRETAAEKAARNLKDATDALATSLGALATTTEGLGRANSSLATEETSLQSAQLAAAQAQAAVNNSSAAKGSFERKQVENALAIALDNVRLAERRLADARTEQSRLIEEQRQAQINLRADRMKEVAAIEETVNAIRREMLARQFRVGAGSSTDAGRIQLLEIEAASVDELSEKLRKRADEEAANNTESSRAVAERLRLIANLAQQTDQFPSEKTLEVLITAPNIKTALEDVASEFGIGGDKAIAAFVASLTTGPQEAIKQLRYQVLEEMQAIVEVFAPAGQRGADAFWRAVIAGTKEREAEVAAAIEGVINRSTSRIASLDREALDLEIAGASDQAILANLQKKQAEQEKFVKFQEGRFAKGEISVESVTAAKEKLRDTTNQIKSLEEGIASDAKSAQREREANAKQKAKDIQDAKDKADQAVLDMMFGKRGKIENLIARAGQNEGLGDDIKFNRQLRAILIKQRKAAATLIKDLEKRRDFIRDTTKLIIALTGQIKTDQAAQKDAIRKQRDDRAAERDAKLTLNIEFAQINENVRAEIRARQARIRALQAQQRQLIKEKGQRAKNTAAYLELRNAVAREKAAIKELREENEALDNEASKMIFQFLQTQQGFAANLLGNLFPTDGSNPLMNQALAGGGTPPTGKESRPTDLSKSLLAGLEGYGGGLGEAAVRRPGSYLGPEAAVADAKDRGPTSGQSNVQITLLREIRDILRGTSKGSGKSHPEARFQVAEGRAGLDILGP